MTINVTQLHLDNGNKWEQSSCAVALALESAGLRKVAARYRGFNATANGTPVKGSFPSSVAEKMEAFDYGRCVKPFSFDVTLTQDVETD